MLQGGHGVRILRRRVEKPTDNDSRRLRCFPNLVSKQFSRAICTSLVSARSHIPMPSSTVSLVPPRKKNNVRHHPALPYGQVPAFMKALRERDAVAARALEFTILTAARTVDTLGATWREVNLVAKTWIIPKERMQADIEHKIPLSDRALEIVKEMAAIEFSDFIFAGVRGGLSNMAMLRVLARLGRSDLTVFGFRSTFRNWAAERTAYPNHVIEMALAHHVSNKVVAPSRQRDLFVKRAKLMNDWAEYCTIPGATAQSRQKSLNRPHGRQDRTICLYPGKTVRALKSQCF